MTQPLCAYEGCRKVESRFVHFFDAEELESLTNHRFQPQSTVESAPELDTRSSIHRPGCPRFSGVGECDCFDDIPASTSPLFNSEINGTVALDGDTRRSCNNEDCSQGYQHQGSCDKPAAQSGEQEVPTGTRNEIGMSATSASGSPSSGAGEVCIRCNQDMATRRCHQCDAPLCDHICEEWHLEKDCQGFDDIPASASPQGAGEQWKPDCDIEAMRNALSKLESQVCRNPDLPEAYKTILRDGFKAVGNIELRLKAGAQGAVPGPQRCKCGGLFVCGFCGARLATPEPSSPHVHNFDANGICVTMGCTPAEEQGNHIVQSPEMVEPAAASTDERLAEIAEPDLKELIEDFGRACVRFGGTEDGSAEESEAAAKSNKLHDDLLRLVAELCQKINENRGKLICSFCGTIHGYDPDQEHGMVDAVMAHIETCEKSPLVQLLDANRENLKLQARAEQAERERDETQKQCAAARNVAEANYTDKLELESELATARQRIAVLEGKQ